MASEARGAVAIGVVALIGMGLVGSLITSKPPAAARAVSSYLAVASVHSNSPSPGSTTFYGEARTLPAEQTIDLASLSRPAVEIPAPVDQVRADRPIMIGVQSVKLRKEPRANSPTAGTAIKGEAARELAGNGPWRQIELADGRKGWLKAAALDGLMKTSISATPSKQTPAALLPQDLDPPSATTTAAALAVAALIVRESRTSYSGSCGCPDDRDRGGRKCGGRSAYSRGGGRSLFCYAADVPAGLISKRLASR